MLFLARQTEASSSPRWYSFGCVLLLGVFLALSGCETLSPTHGDISIGNPDPSGKGGRGGVENDANPPEIRAYYLLHAGDLQSPDWPEAFLDYRVFICTPTLSDAQLAQVRAAIPDAILLASTSAQDMAIDTWHGNPYYEAMEDYFDQDFCIRNLNNGEIVRIWSLDPNNPEAIGIPAFIMNRQSADAIVDFHRDVTLQVSWDGLYIDMCTQRWPWYRKNRLEYLTNDNYDIDNDGSADTRADIDRIYERWRPYYAAQLRQLVGEDAILLGNSEGRLIDPALNGITLEKVGERISLEDARGYFLDHEASTSYDALSIAWVFSNRDELPSLRISDELPWVHYGDITD